MNVVMSLIGLLALFLVAVRLARLVARDGLGSNLPPRSHGAELGTWADRQLQR
ncbi:hypothetical protein [Aeromicrobium fastidiosum]|uniref:hypothetical protein n=1 Tax=Aeromicrobium fastidiosum TaxID=52699 RepID=UPI00165F850C|nr:hypothetical protein [Aeromicrobium fastidiosum]MBP2391459.1 hypothetical protein [Aeromicrobium fastidiosum]